MVFFICKVIWLLPLIYDIFFFKHIYVHGKISMEFDFQKKKYK